MNLNETMNLVQNHHRAVRSAIKISSISITVCNNTSVSVAARNEALAFDKVDVFQSLSSQLEQRKNKKAEQTGNVKILYIDFYQTSDQVC